MLTFHICFKAPSNVTQLPSSKQDIKRKEEKKTLRDYHTSHNHSHSRGLDVLQRNHDGDVKFLQKLESVSALLLCLANYGLD